MTDPTPAVPAVPSAPAGEVAPVATNPPKGKGLGIFAMILGLIAFLTDLGVLIFAIAQIINLTQSFDVASLMLGLGGFIVFAFIAFWGGIVVGALAVLLGIIAAVKNRGRGAGIFGTILGILVLGSHVIVGLAVAGSGQLLSGLGS